MCRFPKSFNLSLATAITLAYMTAIRGRVGTYGAIVVNIGTGDIATGIGPNGGNGIGFCPLRPGDLDPHKLQCLKLRGILNSLTKKQVGKILLDRERIVLPNSL